MPLILFGKTTAAVSAAVFCSTIIPGKTVLIASSVFLHVIPGTTPTLVRVSNKTPLMIGSSNNFENSNIYEKI